MKGKEASRELIHVTMHVVSRKATEELRADKHIERQVDAALRDLMHPVQSGKELARRLSLPSAAHVQWSVEIAALRKGVHTHEGHIPIMVSVAGVPGIMEKLRPEVVEEVTNVLFKEIRKGSYASKDLAKALGYDADKPANFHLYLPHEVRVRGSAGPIDYGDGDDDDDDDGGYESPVWVEGGWSKG
jgi:hypothetical protein